MHGIERRADRRGRAALMPREETDTARLREAQGLRRARFEFAVRVGIVAAAAIAVVLAVLLVDLVLLLFAAALFALLLRQVADPLARLLRCPPELAVVVSFLGLFGGGAGLLFAFGRDIAAQLALLRDTLPEARHRLVELTQAAGLDRAQIEALARTAGGHAEALLFSGRLGDALYLAGGVALAIVLGLYLAAQPRLYKRGAYRLLPARHHPPLDRAIAAVSEDLRYWMLGQLVTMVFIGVMTGAGAWLLGLPAPFALGLIAGLLEFVPYLGPLLTVIPAVLLGLTVDLETAVLALVWLITVQQVEGYLVTPLVQRQAVAFPPAVSLLAMTAGGLLFGTMGVVLAIPFAVAARSMGRSAIDARPQLRRDMAATFAPHRAQPTEEL